MTDMQELLNRTTLKAVGTFLRSDENPVAQMLREDIPPKALLDGRRDDLWVALRRANAASCLNVYSSACKSHEELLPLPCFFSPSAVEVQGFLSIA